MRRRALAAVLVCAALAVALLGPFRRLDDGVGMAAGPAWEIGRRYRYALSYRNDEAATVFAGAALSTRVRVAGEWVVTPRARRGGVTVVGLRFEALTEGALEVQGQAVAAQLDGAEIFAELGAGGEVGAVFAGHQPPVRLNVMRMILGELQTRRPAAGAQVWSGSEATLHGDAEATIEWRAGRAIKRRTRYSRIAALPRAEDMAGTQRVDHAATLELGEGGVLARAISREEIDAATGRYTLRSELRLELLEVEPATETAAPDLDALSPVALEQPLPSGDQQAELLAQRIAGMTWTDLDAGLRLSIAPDPRYLWRATGLLTRDPSLCLALIPAFTREGATLRQRALILDVLAAVDHPLAQAVMRALLRTPAGRQDEQEFVRLVQSFLLVEHPAAETAAFLEAEHAAAVGDRQVAAAYALGAVAAGATDEETARRIDDTLRAGIDGAKGFGARTAYVAALGNARRASDGPLFGTLAAEPQEHISVRLAATRALGRMPGDDAVEQLLQLAGAAQRHVQRTALHELARRALSAPARQRAGREVARLISGGGLDATNVLPALDLLQTLEDAALRREALLALRPLAAGHDEVALRLERLIAMT